jgi:two-component system, OmpR family, sensor histidine kinase KdpD
MPAVDLPSAQAIETASQAGLREDLRSSVMRSVGTWRMPMLILAATSILAFILEPLLDGEVSSGLIFVIGITLVGAKSGLTPAIVCAMLASAIFNFFLADPVLTFRMVTGDDLAPPFVFTACAIVSGLLAGTLRDKTYQLGAANLQLEGLLETSRNLQRAASETDIVLALKATVPAMLGINLGLYRFGADAPIPIGDSPDDAIWVQMARRALRSEADTLRCENMTGYILHGSAGRVGVLVVGDGQPRPELDDSFMLALAQVIGLALERAQFAAVIAETEANARTEELKSALLSSVSHDLRTPLTAISASASSLIEFGSRLDGATSRHLLQEIVDECDRLNRFTGNLLELSRLQSGDGNLVGQVLSVNDVVRSVVHRTRTRAKDREIRIATQQSEILVVADTALFELALTNVIENALLYSDPDTAVLVQTECYGDTCAIRVCDQGCGIPLAEQSRVFERFYRAKRTESSPQGSGLGLAITKGFVEAFHGSIKITSPVESGKGTSVTITLPAIQEAMA